VVGVFRVQLATERQPFGSFRQLESARALTTQDAAVVVIEKATYIAVFRIERGLERARFDDLAEFAQRLLAIIL